MKCRTGYSAVPGNVHAVIKRRPTGLTRIGGGVKKITIVDNMRERALGAGMVVNAVEEHCQATRVGFIDKVTNPVLVTETCFYRMEDFGV